MSVPHGSSRAAATGVWIVATLVVLGSLLANAPAAEACAVCFQAKNDASRVAFIATTGFMTFLPLVLISAVAWWVRSRFAAAARAETEDRIAAERIAWP